MNGMNGVNWMVSLGRWGKVVKHRGLLVLVLLGVVGVLPADAQRRRRAVTPPEKEPNFKEFNVPYDGLLTFVRLRYTPSQYGWGGGGGAFGGVDYNWDHDYPRADRHLMTIVDELTAAAIRSDGSNVLGADDPELFKYPIAYMSEPGYWTLTEREAANFRAYLAKGGFIIFDDFTNWQYGPLAEAMRKVLPEGRVVQLDASHPIFHSFFDINTLDYYHPYRGGQSYFLGIFEDNDPTKRLLVIMNYNNDVGESWEWSDQGFIPIELSNTAFRLGVNYFMYALTH
ncbi:MAG: DUF4159 domain-containing protein [Gemmatimonadota bacterium]|nr:DUF4159 domain-containing protein [Gemmatimonadota bacterium]MDH5199208.1 DUF4159 domain-containing protein [Gemmatimonadota bacterium]